MIAMETEIDLQDYIDVILKRWKVVLVVFLAATVMATVASFLQPSTYEATVTLMEGTYEFLDTPRLTSLDRTVVKLYPTLARTEAVANRVIEALGSELSPADLLSMVTVREDNDNPVLFRIKVEADDPDKAVEIANTWAEQYLQVVGSPEVSWSSQLEVVEQNLESAEEALAAFQQETGLGLVRAPGGDEAYIVLGLRGVELERKLHLLAEHHQARDNLRLLLQGTQQTSEASDGIEDLPLQLLNVPVIIDRGQLSAQFIREQEDLDNVISLLEAEEEIISKVVDELSLEVERLQGELVQDSLEHERLVRAADLAEGAYTALTNEMQQAQLFQNRTQILSEATKAKLVGPDRKLNIAVGAALGLAGGVLAAFAIQYFQRIRERT
jgi:capsular polysaccharide biosynthesis protein